MNIFIAATHRLCLLMECDAVSQQLSSVLEFVIEISPRFSESVRHRGVDDGLAFILRGITISSRQELFDLFFFCLKT